MLDRLLDAILQFGEELLPFFVVNPFSAGIVVRLGKFNRVVDPGFHLKVPFADKIHEEVVIPTTMDLPSQTITSRDGLQVVAKCIIKYEIADIKEFMFKIYDAKDAIADTAQGIIRRNIAALTWAQCGDPELENTITKKTRVELRKWGIALDTVTFTNLGLTRSLRLFNERDPEHRLM